MSDGKRNFLPVLLLPEVCQVVVAKQAIGNAALTHPLLTKHHKPEREMLALKYSKKENLEYRKRYSNLGLGRDPEVYNGASVVSVAS